MALKNEKLTIKRFFPLRYSNKLSHFYRNHTKNLNYTNFFKNSMNAKLSNSKYKKSITVLKQK